MQGVNAGQGDGRAHAPATLSAESRANNPAAKAQHMTSSAVWLSSMGRQSSHGGGMPVDGPTVLSPGTDARLRAAAAPWHSTLSKPDQPVAIKVPVPLAMPAWTAPLHLDPDVVRQLREIVHARDAE